MAIAGKQNINVGLPNESANSDSLYTAFNKINTNFDTLFANSSSVVSGNGITITNNVGNSVISANVQAGAGITVTPVNGALVISSNAIANSVNWTSVPSAPNSAGTAGQIAYDVGGNLYVCVATNTWAKFTGNTSW